MDKGALFVGWGPIIAGREAQAKQVLADALQYCDGLQRVGRIDSFDVVVLEPHGGDPGGFVLLKGDKSKIAAIADGDRFREDFRSACSWCTRRWGSSAPIVVLKCRRCSVCGRSRSTGFSPRGVWRARRDSNSRPSGSKPDALSN